MGEHDVDPQPGLEEQRIAPAPDGVSVPAAERTASAMGNQAFGRALAAAEESQVARFSIGNIVADVAQGARDLVGQAAGALPSTSATIDRGALSTRVAGIARNALEAWTATSTIVGVLVTGPTGFGGRLIGAPLAVFMHAAAASAPPSEAAAQAKALQGFGAAFGAWCETFSIPAAPLWPTFAAIPSPQAPPTKGTPLPLIMCAPAPLPLVLAGSNQEEQEALNEVTNTLRVVFDSWRASRMVTNLIGTGPVPTFAPPFVPVGPVAGGTAFAPPPAV